LKKRQREKRQREEEKRRGVRAGIIITEAQTIADWNGCLSFAANSGEVD